MLIITSERYENILSYEQDNNTIKIVFMEQKDIPWKLKWWEWKNSIKQWVDTVDEISQMVEN